MEQNMKDNGLMGKEMVMENRYGQMAQYIKANGNEINQMDKENQFMLMETYDGQWVDDAAYGKGTYVHFNGAIDMKVNGQTIINMVMVLKYGLMNQGMKENINMVKKNGLLIKNSNVFI